MPCHSSRREDGNLGGISAIKLASARGKAPARWRGGAAHISRDGRGRMNDDLGPYARGEYGSMASTRHF